MTPTQLWAIAGIVLFGLEIFTPGFVLANFGVACLASAISSWLGASLTVQLIVFSVTSLVSFVTIRPLLNNRLIKQHFTPTNHQALIGRRVPVTDMIPGGERSGRVQVDGDSWVALSDDGVSISVGEFVKILRVDSNRVFVQR